jgi:nucleotide-binding universal stress UspA family protein
MRVDAACVLDDSIRLARERGAADVSDVLVEGGPAVALVGEVRDGDLLVLGSRGRGAVVAGLFGSTVNAVLERAAVPVVVVRHRPA